jgi:hypothetical protein
MRRLVGRPARRTRALAAGAAAAFAIAAAGGFWLARPPALGLESPRLVVVSGDASVDEGRARIAQAFAAGAIVHTGHGNACFSVHASRVCVGANGEVRLAELSPGGAALEARRGTVIVTSAGDDLRVTFPGAALSVRAATIALEDAGGADPLLRVLDGSARLDAGVGPSRGAPAVVSSPDSVGTRDGKKRAPSPAVEREERGIAALAKRWQGTAGAVVSVSDLHGRVEIDGAEAGPAPASALLDEGEHVLVIRDAGREIVREALKLAAGQRYVKER